MSHPRIPYRVTDDSNVQTLIENLAEKLSKAKGGKGSGKSTGRWVTINGNRVFIDNRGTPHYGADARRASQGKKPTKKPKKPTATIADDYDVYEDSLLELSHRPVVVNGEQVYVGSGSSYTPKKGGQPVSFGGKVVAGPREWLGKDVRDIKDLREEIDRLHEEAVRGDKKAASFKKVKDTAKRDIITENLGLYKNQATSSTGANILGDLGKAYMSNGEARKGEVTNTFQIQMKNYEDYVKHAGKSSFTEQQLAYIKSQEYSLKLSDLDAVAFKKPFYSQESLNQFQSAIKDTQKYYADNYEKGATITLYRGVQGSYGKQIKESMTKGKDVTVQVNPISSWTTSKLVASKFAGKDDDGVVIKKEVKVSDILFSYKVQRRLAAYEEAEVLVGSSTGTIKLSKGETEAPVFMELAKRKAVLLPNIDIDADNKLWLKVKPKKGGKK